MLDSLNDVVGDIGTGGARVVSDDEPHDDWRWTEQGVWVWGIKKVSRRRRREVEKVWGTGIVERRDEYKR